jgi:hypothetical protein
LPASSTTPRRSALRQAPNGSRPAARRRASARYYICLAVLVAGALTMGMAARALGGHFQKQRVDLKKPLALMDQSKLLPDYKLHTMVIPPLTEDVIDSLGTSEYLQWLLVDQNRGQRDPASVAHIFITYYTGKPDMVPHVPDECYQAGGYPSVVAPETVQVPVPGCGAPNDQVAVRLVRFAQSPRSRSPLAQVDENAIAILYFFHANGRFCTTRDEVRLAQASLWDKYAYYSKIEIKFTSSDFQRNASRDESVAAVTPLLRKLLPILLNDHLPNWSELTAAKPAAAGS